MIGDIKNLLLIPRIAIHNANALSSPFTIGFPAMTAWLGAVHALQRQLNEQDFNIQLTATSVICHDMDLQTHKGSNDYVHSIIGTGNPLDKTGSRSAFIEEARCHLNISLLIEYELENSELREDIVSAITHLLSSKLKMAGGDITAFSEPEFLKCQEGDDKDMAKTMRKLMPGYALIERRDLMINAMQQGSDALDALIDYVSIHHHCETDEDNNITWHSQRKSINDNPAGWIVPIATGFHAISKLEPAKNQRDQDIPHRFAESIITLGEFKMPHRFKHIEELMWRYHSDKHLYLCQQSQYQDTSDNTLDSYESEF